MVSTSWTRMNSFSPAFKRSVLCLAIVAILIMSNLYDDSSDDDSFQGQVLIFRQCSPLRQCSDVRLASLLAFVWSVCGKRTPAPPRRAAPGPPGNSRIPARATARASPALSRREAT